MDRLLFFTTSYDQPQTTRKSSPPQEDPMVERASNEADPAQDRQAATPQRQAIDLGKRVTFVNHTGKDLHIEGIKHATRSDIRSAQRYWYSSHTRVEPTNAVAQSRRSVWHRCWIDRTVKIPNEASGVFSGLFDPSSWHLNRVIYNAGPTYWYTTCYMRCRPEDSRGLALDYTHWTNRAFGDELALWARVIDGQQPTVVITRSADKRHLLFHPVNDSEAVFRVPGYKKYPKDVYTPKWLSEIPYSVLGWK